MTRRRAASRRVSPATVSTVRAVTAGLRRSRPRRAPWAPSRRIPRSRSSRLMRFGSTAWTWTPSATRSATSCGTPWSTESAAKSTVNQPSPWLTRPEASSLRSACSPTSSSRSLSSCWPSSSARVPAAATAPWSRITTRSQTRSTSPIRWELSRTATPRCFSERTRSRTSARPTGSSALVGSSRITSSGRATSATASPSRCCIPLEKPPTRSSSRPASPTAASPSRTSWSGTATPARRVCSRITSAAVSHGW